MKPARSSFFNKIVLNTTILIFTVLVATSALLIYLFRQELLRAGLSEAEAYASIYSLSVFIFVFIVVASIASAILALIFIEEFRAGFSKLIYRLTGFDISKHSDLLTPDPDADLGVVTEKINKIVGALEEEINKDTALVAQEHKKYLDEQSLLALEQKKIFDEQEKLNYVLSGISDGVILLTRNRNIAVMNKSAQELTGFKQGEAVGKSVSQLIKFISGDREIHPDEYAPLKNPADNKSVSFSIKNIRMETSQATPKNIDLLCAKLSLIQAQDYGFMISLHDLTARSEIQQKTTDLLSSFAIELNNPLTLLYKAQGDNPDVASFRAGLANINITVDNLLIAGKDDSEKIEINSEDLLLDQIAQESIDLIRPSAAEKGIEIQTVIPKDISFKVKADKDKLKIAIMNLLVNAVNFTLSGGTISLEISQSDSDFILQIQDTGIGIKSEDTQKLFNRFATAENDKQIHPGIGLGLYVSKKIIDAHGGKIWLDSVEGRGTIANISLTKVV